MAVESREILMPIDIFLRCSGIDASKISIEENSILKGYFKEENILKKKTMLLFTL